MTEHVKALKVKDEEKDKSNKLISFPIEDVKLLLITQAIWTMTGDLKKYWTKCFNDHRHIKTKIRTYGVKFYTKFRGLNEPEDDIECESFKVISADSLFV